MTVSQNYSLSSQSQVDGVKEKKKKRIWVVKQICSKCSLGCQDRELNIIPELHKTLSADADQPRFICKETSKLDWITFSIKLKINNNNTDLPLVCHKCHMFISLSQHCPVCEDHPLMEWSPEKWARSCGKGGKFPTQLKIECQLKNCWKKNSRYCVDLLTDWLISTFAGNTWWW